MVDGTVRSAVSRLSACILLIPSVLLAFNSCSVRFSAGIAGAAESSPALKQGKGPRFRHPRDKKYDRGSLRKRGRESGASSDVKTAARQFEAALKSYGNSFVFCFFADVSTDWR